jgi:predicted RNA binding protein YcfA (HicA-like mRNA interferase family)
MPLSSREALKSLKAAGFVIVDQKGSHVQLKHPARAGRVTVPHPKRELPVGTIASIERQSGIKIR